MRITELHYERTKNLGNYENHKVSLNGVLEDDEKVNDALTQLQAIVDWFLNLEERNAKYQRYVAELATETCEKREQKEKWVAQYETRKAEMEAI